MHDLAALLKAFVTSSAAPYGKEYSVRWRNGIADHDRFLMSIHKLDLAGSAVMAREKLEDLLQLLCCPVESSQQLWDYWNNTSVVHFGFEQTAACEPYLKIYFEITARNQTDMRKEQLIHVAVKWNPQHPANAAFSRYSLVPCDNANVLGRQLHRLCPECFLPAFEKLIQKALTHCDVSEIMLLAITDDNSPRESLDLNLYNSRMTIGDSITDLLELSALNGCEESDWLTSHKDRLLGHLAAGRDRDRSDFVTLYYGVESH